MERSASTCCPSVFVKGKTDEKKLLRKEGRKRLEDGILVSPRIHAFILSITTSHRTHCLRKTLRESLLVKGLIPVNRVQQRGILKDFGVSTSQTLKTQTWR